VGAIAYKLQLPPQAKIHSVFHVSVLKKHIGPPSEPIAVLDMDELGMLAAELVALARGLGKKGNRAVVYVLIQWSNKPREEATWELYSEIEAKFPNFSLAA